MDLEKKLQYLLDRQAIADQVNLYATIVDRKAFNELDKVFTKDAWIDYTASGGAAGDFEATKAFLEQSMQMFSSTQHLMSNVECEIAEDGRTAKTEVMLFNPLTMAGPDGPYTFFCGVWYHDEWVKTEEGVWKMTRRVQENSYAYHRPNPPKAE